MYASKAGDIDKVRKLLDEGADPGFKDKSGNTPVHCAKTPEVLDALLQAASRGETVEVKIPPKTKSDS